MLPYVTKGYNQRHVIKLNEQNEMDDIKTGDIIILLVITGGKARSRGNWELIKSQRKTIRKSLITNIACLAKSSFLKHDWNKRNERTLPTVFVINQVFANACDFYYIICNYRM